MQKKRFLIATLTIILSSVVFGTVYAQEETPEPAFEMWYAVLAMSSFFVAGVFYSSSGWIKKVRRRLGGADESIDYRKMGKSILIGMILGIGAIIFSTMNGDVILVTNAEEFFVQVGLNVSVILLVDKWILGRAPKDRAGPTGDMDDEFEDLWDELPVEVPPGKTNLDLSEPLAIRLGNQDPNKMMFRADRGTRTSRDKTIDGRRVNHIAIQPSRRTRRKKKTIHVYHIEGTDLVVFNQRENGFHFLKIAIRPENVKRFYETFVKPPVTDPEQTWLDLYGYILDN